MVFSRILTRTVRNHSVARFTFSAHEGLTTYNDGKFWSKLHSDNSIIVGFNEHWLEKQVPGDIDMVTMCTASSLSIDYSGLSYSEADELYHSIWKNTEGSVKLSAESMRPPFFSGSPCNIEINPEVLNHPYIIDENTWIFKFSTK